MSDDAIENLSRLISSRYPDSQLAPVAEEHLQELQNDHPDVPEHLLAFYRRIGCGSVGPGRYMIHFATYPDEIYDEETAADLGKIMIVGDNYAGDCDGYNIDQNWSFGTLYSSYCFAPAGADYPTIVEWLLLLLGDD